MNCIVIVVSGLRVSAVTHFLDRLASKGKRTAAKTKPEEVTRPPESEGGQTKTP